MDGRYLETPTEHGKLKLALAILTSPGAAFEEITQRKLLGTAFTLVALTGTMSMIGAIARGLAVGPAQWLALGKDNPLTWVGLFMLYALALQKLLKWLGTETDYITTLLVLGWSHVILLIHQTAGTVWSFASLAGVHNPTVMQTFDALRMALPIWYVIVAGTGIQTACRVPLARGIMSYFVVAAIGAMAFDFTYGRSRLAPFAQGLPGVMMTAMRLTPTTPDPWLTAPDQLPKLAAAVLGLTFGTWNLAKALAWDPAKRTRLVAAAGVVGALVLGIYTLSIYKTDYYGRLASAQQLYDLDRFSESAKKLETLLPMMKGNAALMLDIADTYYLAGNGDRSILYYNKFLDVARKLKLSKEDSKGLAQPLSGIGAVYDMQGKNDLAIKQFEEASRTWPEFRDPWVRLAVTYDRMGDYPKAIESGEHATKKLGSKAAVAYLALAQAYAQTGDEKQAKAAADEVRNLNKDLADTMGKSPSDWKTAVTRLTRKDLKSPLERQQAPAPPKPARGAKPRARA